MVDVVGSIGAHTFMKGYHLLGYANTGDPPELRTNILVKPMR